MDITEFKIITENLLNNNNEIRLQYENIYNELVINSPYQVAQLLAQLLIQGSETNRFQASVLLRRLFFSSNENGLKCNHEYVNGVGNILLQQLSKESKNYIKKSIIHTISQLAAVASPNNMWPELIPFTLNIFNSNDIDQLICGLMLIEQLSEYDSKSLINLHNELFIIFKQTFEINNEQIQITTMQALSSYLVEIQNQNEREKFESFLPQMLSVIELSLNNGNEQIARDALNSLVTIAEIQPNFYLNSFEKIIRMMLIITSSQSMESSTRELSLELVISLAESFGPFLRKFDWLVGIIVPLAVSLFCEIEENTFSAEFQNGVGIFDTFGLENSEENRLAGVAIASFEAISKCFGGKTILKITFPILSEFVISNEWKKRRASVVTVTLLAGNCRSALKKELYSVVPIIVKLLVDVHPLVRHAAVHCIAQIATDFGDFDENKNNFQSLFHSIVFPNLLICLNDSFSAIKAITAAAIINICHPAKCKPDYISPFFDQFINCFIYLIQNSTFYVKEQSITAIGCLSQCSPNQFLPFYNSLLPILFDIFSLDSNDNNNKILKGKSLEAFGLFGVSVGKNIFTCDAHKIMLLILNAIENNSNDFEFSFFIQFFTRICVILKDEFYQYFQRVLLLIEKCLNEPVDIMMCDSEEFSSKFSVDELSNQIDPNYTLMEVAIRGEGKRMIAVNSSLMQDKQIALQCLFQLTSDLPHLISQYISRILLVVLPLLQWKYTQSVRVIAAAIIPKLINIIKNINDVSIENVYSNCISSLLQSIVDESDQLDEMEALCVAADAFSDCLKIGKENMLSINQNPYLFINDELVPHIITTLRTIATKCLQKRWERQQQNNSLHEADEDDQEIENEITSWESDLLTSIVDSIGWIIKSKKSSIIPLFNEVLRPFVLPILHSNFGNDLQLFALCMLIDVVEHCGPSGADVAPIIFPIFVNYLMHEDADMRQTASYGIGVIATYTPNLFDQENTPNILQLFIQLIMAPESRDDDNGAATDNAISAVYKMFIHLTHLINAVPLIPIWTSWLPLRFDLMEAHDLHSNFISQLSQFNILFYGENYTNLPIILSTIAQLMDCNSNFDDVNNSTTMNRILKKQKTIEQFWEDQYVDEKTRRNIDEYLQILQKTIPIQILQQSWGTLSQQQQQSLQLPTDTFLQQYYYQA